MLGFGKYIVGINPMKISPIVLTMPRNVVKAYREVQEKSPIAKSRRIGRYEIKGPKEKGVGEYIDVYV